MDVDNPSPVEAGSGQDACVTNRSTIALRSAIPHDRSVIEACVDAAYSPFIEAIGRQPAPMLDDYERLIDEGRVSVAEDADHLVGLIVMWGEPDHWYVDNIAVDPQRQASGVGSALLAEAERQARQAGFVEIRLYTNEAMTSNHDFYPKRGFVETHRAVDRGYRRIFYTRALRTA